MVAQENPQTVVFFMTVGGDGGDGEMGRLVLSGAVGAASRREVWGDRETRRINSEVSSQQSTVNNLFKAISYL